MITGLGLDVIETERVAEKIQKEQGFRELVFSQEEIGYCEPKAHKYEHYAARFAAKEAFLKALGTGWADGTAFNEIQVLGDEQGKPVLSLKGQTAETLKHLDLKKVQLSLSHLKTIAAAVVIIEQ
ncbi:holo-ACP synthase [Niabella drilacis]|uniref:Holo-[acyl-carrier-protein] synthase n=1 Tax=Niabella drilacis (strain DSM 25811 / CCM 8410 / CCUG 62505 / LMG 26954 / E90) TaxID=1285928 RepID=A0A1G6NG22_NIADE|nr:holo-ACP synthase [Niabella drilacis]SDC66286.1 holo-[acyl-carrier protein] synthase [Niabella drilacis]